MSDETSLEPDDEETEEVIVEGKPIKDRPDNRGQNKDKGESHDQGGGNDPQGEPK